MPPLPRAEPAHVMPDISSSTPGSGRGRRSNGLPCADWGALVDLDPRLSEALLSSLGSAGVAAYVEPAGGEDVFSRAAQHPVRPLDRLWVDPIRADTARQVVTAEVADLTTLLSEAEPGATAHGFVHAVPRTAAARVLTPPALPDPPSRRSATARPTGVPSELPPPGGPSAASTPPADPAGADPPPTEPPPADPPAPGPASPPSGKPPQSAADAARESDEAFRRIVEGYSRGADGPVPPWPVSEDVDQPRRPPPQTRRSDRPTRPLHPERQERARPPDPTGRPEQPAPPANDPTPPAGRRRGDNRDPDPDESALPAWVEPAALEDDGHYVPPPPPPVPRLAPKKLAATGTLLVGFLLMFVPGLLLQARTAGVAVFGVLLTVVGAGALIYLMRDAPRDSDPDDGAVV